MNDAFVKRVKSYGKEGEEWLKKIPEIIREHEKKWDLKVLPPFILNYNYVASARNDRKSYVLKIGFPKDKEFQTEIDALEIFKGEGICKIFEIDRENAVILIEKISSGVLLSSINDDEKATRILASIMRKLRKHLPKENKFPTVSDWAKGITSFKQKYGRNSKIPFYLIDKAENLFEELISSSKSQFLLHGDLHHDNVLSSDRDGWLAIDPKGVVGESAYETAAMIRNPYLKLREISNLKELLSQRIKILSEELNLDKKRIYGWGFAQTVLSAVWNIEDIKEPEHAIRVAEELDKLQI